MKPLFFLNLIFFLNLKVYASKFEVDSHFLNSLKGVLEENPTEIGDQEFLKQRKSKRKKNYDLSQGDAEQSNLKRLKSKTNKEKIIDLKSEIEEIKTDLRNKSFQFEVYLPLLPDFFYFISTEYIDPSWAKKKQAKFRSRYLRKLGRYKEKQELDYLKSTLFILRTLQEQEYCDFMLSVGSKQNVFSLLACEREGDIGFDLSFLDAKS